MISFEKFVLDNGLQVDRAANPSRSHRGWPDTGAQGNGCRDASVSLSQPPDTATDDPPRPRRECRTKALRLPGRGKR